MRAEVSHRRLSGLDVFQYPPDGMVKRSFQRTAQYRKSLQRIPPGGIFVIEYAWADGYRLHEVRLPGPLAYAVQTPANAAAFD